MVCKEKAAIESERGWRCWSGEENERYRCEAELLKDLTIFSGFSSWELQRQKISDFQR